ncbi:MAG: efflux RND transporter permease subunit [Lentisphaeria bacterium]
MSDKEHSVNAKDRGPIAYMAGNSVAANLIMLLCLVGGFLALFQIKQEVFPDFDIDAVTISVPYPGASPEEVEEGVITAVEEAVRGLEGVDEVTSVAREGGGTVTVELISGEDLQQLADDIKSEVDRITTFPEDAEEPVIRTASMQRQVLSVVLYGQTSIGNLHQLAEQFRDELIQDPDITQVDLEGVPPREISIEIPQEKLRRYGLSPGAVASRIRNASVDLPSGGVDTPRGEVLVRIQERRDYGRQFARLPIITTAGGSELRLDDIAKVKDTYEETDRYSLYNGLPAVSLNVFRVGKQTPVQVSKTVHRKLEEFTSRLPESIQTAVERDRSEHYRDRVQLLLKNGAIGLVLVLLVLGIFLESRLAFWVMMGIPISFMGSFLLLPATGVTINMLSLFAYIIALGIVVDDAIVVGENIYHHRQEGLPFRIAAIKGTREVAMPVTFSILTNIVAFMPIYFVPGVTGNIFRTIPIVVCLAFIISLIESLFVLPAHLGHRKEKKKRNPFSGWIHKRQQKFSHGFRNSVRKYYGPFLEFCLTHRYMTLLIAVGILIMFGAYAGSGRMGFELFPIIESDFSQASVTLPYGAPVERTEYAVQKIKKGAQQVLKKSGHPELIESMNADIGLNGSHTGRVRVSLADADIREKIGISTTEFTNRWRRAVDEIPGIDNMRFAADIGGPGGRGRPLTIQLSHRSMEVLEQASAELAGIISTYPKVKDVDDGFQPGKPQYDFTVKPEGKSLGLTARDIARQVRNSLYGAEALRQQRGRDEIKVVVRLPEHQRDSEQILRDMMIQTPRGPYVPLRQVAAAERGRAYKTIDRRNGR